VKLFRWIIGSLILACSLPLCSLLLAGTLANLLGCTLNEADVHPCTIVGVPIGSLLYALSAIGWLMIVTLPLGAVGLVTWIGTESVWFVRKRMQERTT
jgi:hypothetical protein